MITSYIISLKKPSSLLELLPSYQLNPVWVRGINGKFLSDKELKNNASSFYSRFGPKSSIAIAMSHIKVWKRFLNSQDDYCIIFEDDVVFEPRFREKLDKSLVNTPKDFDILYLGCFGCQSDNNCMTVPMSFIFNLKNTVKINKYIKQPKVALALHAYIITRKGVSKLLSNIDKNINNHLDVMIFKLYTEGNLNLYSLTNRIVYQTSSDTCNSLNTSNYPFILNKLLSFIHLDKMLRLNYYTSVSFLRFGDYNINAITCIMFIIGFILALCNINIKTLTIVFLLLSLPDILFNYGCFDVVVFHYVIYILPSIIISNLL
jgi:GR25 family glycosyltransferase involved in LPS biosynthesis